jgi:hypothetical protein
MLRSRGDRSGRFQTSPNSIARVYRSRAGETFWTSLTVCIDVLDGFSAEAVMLTCLV